MKSKIHILVLLILSFYQSYKCYSQLTLKASLNLNNFIVYKVDKLTGKTLSYKQTHAFIDFNKDTVLYINIGLCESIFLNDYLYNNKILKSKNYLYNGQLANRELDKCNLAFYKSCYKKINNKNKLILKPLYKLESYEKYFATINYLTDSKETIADSIKATMTSINEIMFTPYNDEELTPFVKEMLINFKKCNHLYKSYFKERFSLVENIFYEIELKFNKDSNQIISYRKTQIIKNLSKSKCVIAINKNEENEIYQIFK